MDVFAHMLGLPPKSSVVGSTGCGNYIPPKKKPRLNAMQRAQRDVLVERRRLDLEQEERHAKKLERQQTTAGVLFSGCEV